MAIEFQVATGQLTRCSELLTLATLNRRQHDGEMFWTPDEIAPDQLLRLAPESGWFLGWSGAAPVATFCLMDDDPSVWPEAAPNEALYVHRLAVHPDWQGRGLSKAALDFALAETRRRGRPLLRLDTGADRQKLLDLYTDFGFKSAGVRPLRHYTSARFELDVSSGQM